ncbi:hypothetical protein SAMN05428989_1951 [Pseudoxanthomonas sp. GM95]|uniref:hypothetical protein n=1 Tax=Pseudoxanthomonas sp. GM95 TaxID=1881043 RepID=UPI0008C4871C|nr:hypothetical protein [Pseudoxanthomonas sp. GM95]SEL57017.1 hypothetical protein SAMN05428989_1951 [Pseudoxanthomonas sp. GM95]
MSTRESLDRQLQELGDMLPDWLEKLRHPTQFWPQFDALAQGILDDCPECELPYVRRRLALLLQRHGLVRPDQAQP